MLAPSEKAGLPLVSPVEEVMPGTSAAIWSPWGKVALGWSSHNGGKGESETGSLMTSLADGSHQPTCTNSLQKSPQCLRHFDLFSILNSRSVMPDVSN